MDEVSFRAPAKMVEIWLVVAQAAAAPKEKDPDPDGEQLARVADPLGEALKLVRMLRSHAGDRLRTHVLAFEVRAPLHRAWPLPSVVHHFPVPCCIHIVSTYCTIC